MREESRVELCAHESSSAHAATRSRCATAVAAALLAMAVGTIATPAVAQEAGLQIEAGPARSVSRNDLKRMMQAAAQQVPVASRQAPFRPTMSAEAYAAAKADAASASDAIAKPAQEGDGNGKAPRMLAPPSVKAIQFNGVDMATAGGWTPPDTNGAVGKYHYCQVVNSWIRCFQKGGTSAVLLSTSLNSFVGYATQPLFDPRIVYDATWNRWVFAAAAFAESSTVQYYFIAVSKDPSPLHGWWIYSINAAWAPDYFWDYAGLGLDQDAVIFTGNVFTSTYIDSRVFSVAKARLYNGLEWSVRLFSGLSGTLQPPIVLDQDGNTYVVAAEDNTTGTIRKYTFQNTSHPGSTSMASSAITVTPWSMPPEAQQPGTAATLDTLDGRFQNNSTQNGGMLWQTHTVGVGSYPLPRWYKFDVAADAVAANGTFYVYAGSHDFNPSIAANAAGDVFVNWAMTCPSASLSECPGGQKTLRDRFSGKLAADASIIGANPLGGYGSSGVNVYSGNRFGDYSAVSIDPTDSSRAWITNEFFTGPSSWGTRIARIGF